MIEDPATPSFLPLVDDSRYVPLAVAATPAAIGCAMGVLIGGKLRESHRPTVALGLLTIGLAAALPLAIDYVGRRINHPESPRGSRRRLKSIRDAAIPAEEGIYGGVAEDPETEAVITL